jgi:hypothetical protein
MRNWKVLSMASLDMVSAGCATTPYPPGPGPRVEPNDKEWKRKSVPLPPLYLEFTSGSGQQCRMATPLYWQAIGAETESYHLVPFGGYTVDRATGASRGRVLNYLWGGDSERSYRVGFPLYWSFDRPGVETRIYGPVYRRTEEESGKRRLVVFPWLFSRETNASGYDYWGILCRLVGYETQAFNGEQKERLWLFFAFHVDTA